MYFRPRGCPKKDKICGSWIGALGGYAGVLAERMVSTAGAPKLSLNFIRSVQSLQLPFYNMVCKKCEAVSILSITI